MDQAGADRPRVLIVEDEADIANVIEVTLNAEGFDTRVELNGTDGIAATHEWQPDVVLLDVMMPEMDGVEVCRRLRNHPTTAAVSILMLTAKTMPSDRVVGLTAGADDYISKPFDVDELVARVHSALRRSRQLRGISPLTGLPGNFEITREIEHLLVEGRAFAVMHVDLDDFKAYNDHYGFLQGDVAIQRTADALAAVVVEVADDVAFLGHVGGDDFVIVCDAALATAVADAALRAFDDIAPTLYEPEDQLNGWIEVEDRGGQTHRYPYMSLSIGIASTEDRQYGSPGEMAAVAGEMKVAAKAVTGSAWRMDRRTE